MDFVMSHLNVNVWKDLLVIMLKNLVEYIKRFEVLFRQRLQFNNESRRKLGSMGGLVHLFSHLWIGH